MPWTNEKTSLLVQLNSEGLSATQMGAKLGVSRNAVIGKLSRIGVKMFMSQSFRRKRIPKPKPPLQKRLMLNRIQDVTCVILPIERIDVKREDGKTFLELKGNDCRWPFGDRNYYFCGRQTEEGKPYCFTHTHFSYRR